MKKLLDKCIFLEYSYSTMKGRNLKKNILRFTISMEKDLLDELLRITGQRKKSKAVNVACREFVRMKQKEYLLNFKGKVSFEDVNE